MKKDFIKACGLFVLFVALLGILKIADIKTGVFSNVAESLYTRLLNENSNNQIPNSK